MALNPPTPWLDVTPQSFVQAGSAGAAAGEAAARTALEAQSERDRIGMEVARLSNAEHIAAMETQARQEIAQQNQLRQEQELAMDAAYKQSVIGLQRQKLDQQSAIAEQKGKDAAMAFASSQGLASDLAAGMPFPQAYARHPVTASIANALRPRTEMQPGKAWMTQHPEMPGRQFLVDPRTGTEHLMPEEQKALTQNQILLEIARLKRERAQVFDDPAAEREIDSTISAYRSQLQFKPSDTGGGSKYVVGGRYRMGDKVLKYKGPDPNDQSSWEASE